jgi:hypothetical protein
LCPTYAKVDAFGFHFSVTGGVPRSIIKSL